VDTVIQEIEHEVLTARRIVVPVAQMRRWAEYLRDVVQPQLDELVALKASAIRKGKTTTV